MDLIDDLRAHQHGVDGDVRTRRVPAATFDFDGDAVGGCHQRARPQRELAHRKTRIIVHPVDFLDAEAVHQAVLNHGSAAAAALLGRLEDHDRGAGEVARLGEIMRGTEQHRGMAVVAAGVHLARRRRLVGQSGRFLDRQRIHIGAQPDRLHVTRACGLAALDDADNAGAANA